MPSADYDKLRERLRRLRKLAESAKKRGQLKKAAQLERAALRVLQEMRGKKA